VDGDVAGVPGGYVASLRLVATEDGKELASFHEAADTPRALIQAADQLVRDLRAKLGESLRTVNAMPELYDWTTSSTDALRAFALAIRAGRAGHVEDAVRHYREAVRIGSTFAMAWANLGTALKVLGLNAAADSAQRHAYALKDHLTRGEQLYLTANYFGFPCQRDPVKAADAFQQLVDLGDSLKRGRS
jgi:tetratricopeptide (TPR) repeat protein